MYDYIVAIVFIFIYLIALYIAYRYKVVAYALLVGIFFATVGVFVSISVGGWNGLFILLFICPLLLLTGTITPLIVKGIRALL